MVCSKFAICSFWLGPAQSPNPDSSPRRPCRHCRNSTNSMFHFKFLPANEPCDGLGALFYMASTNNNHGLQGSPQYYRAQALKARLAAEEAGLPDDVRDTYLEIAEQWEALARKADPE